eukprot:3234392-Prymnesium_polylepis.1
MQQPHVAKDEPLRERKARRVGARVRHRPCLLEQAREQRRHMMRVEAAKEDEALGQVPRLDAKLAGVYHPADNDRVKSKLRLPKRVGGDALPKRRPAPHKVRKADEGRARAQHGRRRCRGRQCQQMIVVGRV